MDLRSDYPYWLLRKGIIRSYPSLQHDANADVLVMGGGISGALTAWYLVNAGFDTMLADRRHIGMGSTVASTSLIQYEIDVPLHKLIGISGEKAATRSYILCREAIDILAGIAGKLPVRDLVRDRPSFQFASYKKDIVPLQEEYRLRKKIGFDLYWMNEKDIRDKYGFSKHGGLLSTTAAEADAYGLTHALLGWCIDKGLKVYDHTTITGIRHHKNGVELVTAEKKTIRARKLIIACGYESQQYIPKRVQQLHSTYAIISEPSRENGEKELWYRNSLIWETRMPYLYLRTTADNRVIIGGKDIDSSNPVKRDKLLPAKALALERSFRQLFPSIPFRTDFRWAGNFGSTKDGLPYIGSIPQRPHTYFALGLGGNGITFSVIAAHMICDMLCGRKNKDAGIFSFDR